MGSETEKQKSRVRFVFDDCMGVGLVKGISTLGCDNISYRPDIVPNNPKTPDKALTDEEWMPKASSKGYFIVTRDLRVWKRPSQQGMLFDINAGAFIFDLNNLKTWEMAQTIIRKWAWMERAAEETKRPFVFLIYRNGRYQKMTQGISRIKPSSSGRQPSA